MAQAQNLHLEQCPLDYATRVALPEQPWNENWPKRTGTEWILEKDYYETEYWPKGSTYKDSSLIYNKHGALPEGATTTKPLDPNQEQKDTLQQQILTTQEELADLDIDIRYLERKVHRPSATEDDKRMLQELYDLRNTLQNTLQQYIDELNALP